MEHTFLGITYLSFLSSSGAVFASTFTVPLICMHHCIPIDLTFEFALINCVVGSTCIIIYFNQYFVLNLYG